MTRYEVDGDEWYPVFVGLSEDPQGYEIPDTVVARYLAAMEEFKAAERAIGEHVYCRYREERESPRGGYTFCCPNWAVALDPNGMCIPHGRTEGKS